MMLLRIASVLFIFLTIALSIILMKTLRLKRFGLNFADLAFPMFFFEFYLISDQAYYHSMLPQLVLALAILAISITVYFLKAKRSFYYPKFLKFFWRSAFILTTFLYLAMVIGLFLTK